MRSFLAVLVVCLAGAALAQPPAAPASPAGRGPAPALALSSTAFEDGGVIPNKYTYSDPKPVSPALQWTGAPSGIASFTMIMHDVDVANRRGPEDNLHWMVFNIPGSATGLPEDVPAAAATLPDGTVQAGKARGNPGYGAPGAPAGPYHHYIFELYALDAKLDLPPTATRADVLKAMEGHVISKAAMFARFHR
jgi:Raf kinase inhibitor-like YbhB/YbcL family protein